jgi:tetratricopeptide (TPR) repeat protein
VIGGLAAKIAAAKIAAAKLAAVRAEGALALLGCTLLCLACSASRSTERVFNGRTLPGHYIEPEAYAAFTRGAYHEARGEWTEAERAYRQALRSDGESPDIWTRLGALACRTDLEQAIEHFDQAGVREDYAPAWAERARCLDAHQKLDAALEAARHAIQLDPEDRDMNLLVARLYHATAKDEQARAWLFAWLLREPQLGGRDTDLLEQSSRLGDATLSALLHGELARRRRITAEQLADTSALAARPSETAGGVLGALRAGDLAAARLAAAHAKISPLELALLAIENGRPELGLAQAQLLLAADPHDADVLIVALDAASLSGNEASFRALLRGAVNSELPALQRAKVLSKLLHSRIGSLAADHWQDAYLRANAPR